MTKTEELLRTFDAEEVWYLEQIMTSTNRNILLERLNYTKESEEDTSEPEFLRHEMKEFIINLRSKFEKLKQDEIQLLFEDFIVHTYLPNELPDDFYSK